MNVRNCRHCGRIFNYVAGPIMCPACREKMEEKLLECMGCEAFLDAILRAMSTDKKADYFEYIARNYEVKFD